MDNHTLHTEFDIGEFIMDKNHTTKIEIVAAFRFGGDLDTSPGDYIDLAVNKVATAIGYSHLPSFETALIQMETLGVCKNINPSEHYTNIILDMTAFVPDKVDTFDLVDKLKADESVSLSQLEARPIDENVDYDMYDYAFFVASIDDPEYHGCHKRMYEF